MSEGKKSRDGFSADWLIGGVLGKFGEIVDRITGRGWNPSSSLAASKLTEKLQFLLDEESKIHNGGRFVPHIITLKIQWNKFSSDSEEEIEMLEHELHSAAIDHINDKLYHTFAPIVIDVKTDYFTEGVRLIGSFGEFGEEDDEAAINVTVPNITIDQLPEGTRASINLEGAAAPLLPVFTISFDAAGKHVVKELRFENQNRYTVGRAKDNDITVADQSVSKVHASIVIKEDGRLLVADTGSTNGTSINGERIAYGKAIEVTAESDLKFGNVKIVVTKEEVEVVPEVPLEPVKVEPIDTDVSVNPIPVVEKPVPQAAAEPTVSFSDPETPSSPLPQEAEVSSDKNAEDWAMTEHDARIPKEPLMTNDEVSKDSTPAKLVSDEIAVQPPAETIAVEEGAHLSDSNSGDEDWDSFGNDEQDSGIHVESKVSNRSETEDWSAFNSEEVDRKKARVKNAPPQTDSWSEFAESESDSSAGKEDSRSETEGRKEDKEDWEV